MKITIIQTITNTLNDKRELISTSKSESFLLAPDAGKYLKNTKTGEIIDGSVCINSEAKIANFEELEYKHK